MSSPSERVFRDGRIISREAILRAEDTTMMNNPAKAVCAVAIAAAVACGVSLSAQQPADPLASVHPELRTVAEALRAGKFPARMSKPAATPAVAERSVPGPKGAPDVRVYVINGGAKGGPPRPAILHMHGGGYTGGAAALFVPALQQIAAALDCVIVTVDYRLAPATKFPGSLEDNYAALKWLHQNAASLGADGSRIAVMGESAGGGHAAMLAMAARDRKEVPIMFQALIYPMLDDRTGSTRQVPPHIGALVWTSKSNRRGWSALLGVPAGAPNVPAGAVPSRVEALAGLPPAWIGVGAIDLFVEEDIDYAQRLIRAGVAVELNVVPGAFHGFDIFAPDAPITKQFLASMTHALRGAFAGHTRR
jgi:acetyl esterase/lipase